MQIARQEIMFKSYYVVWKPPYPSFNTLRLFGFKSYYVVWKQSGVQGFHPLHGQFKSYYVVWKPLVASKKSIPIYQFKSYYVVWKRDSLFHSFFVLNKV